ncbi:amidohydrolase family protein [Sphingopyxis sp. JAI128]|uniref:N-acyl-D-amino-acid deacylase family protein n=1 Tax=Sphingopyxis sp. JAI128 TaxID=2723066 RepID=UPI0017A2B19D|nr:D-aminoacylase [Sphingopyxis sp. JAI128]MBB6428154.1 N-acyl-D-amino-acid deacylase [Sphingopyxis sp. JAI128]
MRTAIAAEYRHSYRRKPMLLVGFGLSFAAAILAVSGHAAATSGTTTLITDAMIVDGTGIKARRGAVRIEGDRIIAIGNLKAREGEAVIDADGQILSPGFIDTHSHHDLGLSEMPDAVEATSQGITTIIVGQDGSSALPISQLFEKLRETPAAVNVATYAGHNSIRYEVMGDDYKRTATRAEIERMKVLVDQSMEAGALGLSTGLEYDPGIYASKDEVLTLAKETARFGGRYISHMRSEDQFVWAALDEIVNIGRVTGMPVQVSHMKLAMTDWWGQAGRYLAVMDRARAAGIKITGDVYPYEYWQSTLTVMFPKRDFTNRESAKFALEHLAPADGLLLADFSPDPSLVGKTVAQVAAQRGIDPADALMQLIAESQVPDASESVIGTSMRSADVAKLIAWPHSNISSDGMLAGRHPRGAGSFTRILRKYVREERILTLEQAVRKMTGASAEHLGLTDRGSIKVGAHADLVMFDPATVSDRATSENPTARSVGISRVWVNGSLVFKDGRPTGNRPGQLARRATTK